MADSGENRMNLAALQRVDPYIKSIVETASQVALYKFNAKANEWEKTEVEGTLFVYSRCANPLHGFIIMNRLNRDNLIEPLSCDMEFQRQDPFLLYRNAKLVIYGIWFYNKEDCCKIDLVMNRLTEAISARKTSNPDRQRRASESDTRMDPKSVDIISMLTRAQNEFNQNKGPGLRPSEPKVMTDNAINLVDLVRPKAIRVSSSSGPPPDVTSGTSAANDDNNNNTTSLTVAALFASAGRLKQTDASDSSLTSKSDVANPVQKLVSTTAAPSMMDWKPGNSVSLAASLAAATVATTTSAQVGINSLLQRLLSNPEHSVEHIERQQRGGNGLGDTIVSVKSQMDNGVNPPSLVSETEDILLKLQLHSVQANVPDAGNDIPSTGDGNWLNPMLERRLSTTDRKLLPPPVLTPAMIESGINLSPPLLSPMLGTSASPVPPDLGMLALSSTPPRLNPMADVPLMSPMMFSNLKALSDNSAAPKRPADDEMPSLTPEITPLTRDQLSQALIYLLKNDTDFVTKLHEAYVNSLRDLTAANIKS